MLANSIFLVVLPFLAADNLKGFTSERSTAQRELEKKFLSQPSPKNCEKYSRVLTEDPHMAGTPADRKTAEYMLQKFREFGWEAEMVEYLVYLPYPKSASLELLAPQTYTAKLIEEGCEWDKDGSSLDAVIPFNAYSPSGDVSADLVYVNYGLTQDYEKLAELDVDVKGKIVIARYGNSFRGIKTQLAEEHGAIGIILYSDPADDGYAKGDVYPRGPWRPETAVQRGSISCISQYPGDPLSPGWAAVAGAKRLDPGGSVCLPKIPSMPISYADAAPLLEAIAGPNVPEGWQGHLPFAYHVGPGPARVRMKLEMDFADRPIWNVIAKMTGKDYPDQWLMLGNHRDAWVHGAVDPNSGTSVMLELARSFGELKKQGWQPRRSLVLGSWDGEEFGLIGSTEWVEEHEDELAKKALVYINIDSAVCGPNFSASGVPSLAPFIRQIAREVEDPKDKKSIYDLWLAKSIEKDRKKEKNLQGIVTEMVGQEPPVGDLGSGSDFTPFLDRLGVPCLDLSFGGSYGVYHSALDNFYWMSQFGDPGFEYHATMTRLIGLGLLRFSEGDIFPFEMGETGAAIVRYLDSIEKGAKDLPSEFFAARKAAEGLRDKAKEYQARSSEILKSASIYEANVMNQNFLRVEQSFIDREGLKGRNWFRNLLYAPGLYAGYASSTLPGIREAVENKDKEQIRIEAVRLLTRLESATRILSPSNSSPVPTNPGRPQGN